MQVPIIPLTEMPGPVAVELPMPLQVLAVAAPVTPVALARQMLAAPAMGRVVQVALAQRVVPVQVPQAHRVQAQRVARQPVVPRVQVVQPVLAPVAPVQ